MFFVASKVLWILASPLNLALAGALIGIVLAGKYPRGGRVFAALCLGALLLAAMAPLGTMMVRPLEARFPAPVSGAAAPYGIIVLGGAIDDAVGDAHGQVILREGGSRLTEAGLLARRYPDARIVYTGGSPSLTSSTSREAEQARDLLIGLGVDPARITIETRSRNTDENARFTAAIVAPKPDQVWWLVTSAYHMPRAMGLFRKAGFSVRAYPVDFRVYGDARDFTYNLNPIEGLRMFELGAHEWAGLVAYSIDGKIDSWFPGP